MGSATKIFVCIFTGFLDVLKVQIVGAHKVETVTEGTDAPATQDGYNYVGNGVCLNSGGARAPYCQDKATVEECAGNCSGISGCLGYAYTGATWCLLAVNQSDAPSGTNFATSCYNTANTLEISSAGGDAAYYCYKKADAVSATGDPHLVNLRGEKFDIHDGMHRLVHYPRGVPEEEALLIVDAKAVDMGQDSDCYSVYLESIKLLGKWIGDDVVFNTQTKPVASSSSSVLDMSTAHEQMDWAMLSKQHDAHLKLNGSMPVTVATNIRKAFGQEAMGGEEISLKIGDQHPVLFQVWSSHGQNSLTRGRDVSYLNLEVHNLPKNSGGIIGLDHYSRPATSKCDLVQAERNLMNYINATNLLQRPRPQWTASAAAWEQ